MKKIILASACILALASPAGAQATKPLDGASSQGNVGPGCIARRDEGGRRNHKPRYHWREQQTLTRR